MTAVSCSSCLGSASGLNIIPTADVLAPGHISLETESVGAGRLWGDGCDTFSLLQVGFPGSIEAGVDRCTDGSVIAFNAKLRLLSESPRGPALAIGVQSLAKATIAQPYIVLTKPVGGLRVHVGTIRLERSWEAMAGLDCGLGKLLTLQIDHTSGPGNSTSYGVAISLPHSLSLTLATSRGNSSSAGNGHIINLAWSARVR